MQLDSTPLAKLCECGCGQPAPIASSTYSKRGYVKGQPVRFIHGHARTTAREYTQPKYPEPDEMVGLMYELGSFSAIAERLERSKQAVLKHCKGRPEMYQRMLEVKTSLEQPSTEYGKACPQCEVFKAPGEFGYRDATAKYLRAMCFECTRQYVRDSRSQSPEQRREQERRYEKQPENAYRRSLVRINNVYGLSQSDFEALIIEHEGRCGVCGIAGKSLNVDHCHATGRVRGLLCHGCNAGIGMLGDSEERLRNAAAYLEQSRKGVV